MPHQSLPRTRYGVRGLARTQHRSTSNPQTDILTRITYLPAHRIGNRVRDIERLDLGDLRRRPRGIGMPRNCHITYRPSNSTNPAFMRHPFSASVQTLNPCATPGGVEFLPVARLASFRSPHIHQNPQPPPAPNKEQAPNSHNVRLPASRSAGSLSVTPRRPNPIAPSSLRSDRATYSGADLPSVAPHRRFGYHAACPAVRPRSTPSPLQTCQRSRSLRSQPPSAVAGPLWIRSGCSGLTSSLPGKTLIPPPAGPNARPPATPRPQAPNTAL